MRLPRRVLEHDVAAGDRRELGAALRPAGRRRIVAAVGDVLDDPQPWIVRGLERARRYTWEACARSHEDASGAPLRLTLAGESFELRVDEQRDELLEWHFRLPGQAAWRALGRVAHEVV